MHTLGKQEWVVGARTIHMNDDPKKVCSQYNK